MCKSCCLHLVEKRRKLCTRAKKNIQGTINLPKVLPSTVVCIICKKCTTNQKSIIRTVLARMCKKIFRAGRRATRVQISPPFTVFTLALSCIHPVFTPCLHCILASIVLILYSHCSMLYLLLLLQLMYPTLQCSNWGIVVLLTDNFVPASNKMMI